LFDDGVEIDGVPEGEGVDYEAEGAELVFHAFLIRLVEFASTTVEDVLGEYVAAFLEVAEEYDLAPAWLVIDVGEHVQGFEDAAIVGEGFAELGRLATMREHFDDLVSGHSAGVDGADDPQDVGPVGLDAVDIDLASGSGVERAVVGIGIGSPELLVR
jgi:hypothetical protein